MTIDSFASGAGMIDDVFSREELNDITNFVSQMPKHYIGPQGNSFSGISKDHILYSWFNKRIFNRIKELTSVDIQLHFGSFLHEETPWALHSDYYQVSDAGDVNPYMAFLIPLSVNNDMDQVGKTSTVVFNEEDIYVNDPSDECKSWSEELWKDNRTKKENNAVALKEGLLSHLPVEDLECLTVKTIANWQLGSLIYWGERYLHCSDNFVANGATSKQALVIHTYVV